MNGEKVHQVENGYSYQSLTLEIVKVNNKNFSINGHLNDSIWKISFLKKVFQKRYFNREAEKG